MLEQAGAVPQWAGHAPKWEWGHARWGVAEGPGVARQRAQRPVPHPGAAKRGGGMGRDQAKSRRKAVTNMK